MLKPVFGSDIGHWDVLDAATVVTEAWDLVERKLITPENFRDLTFVNPALLHLALNPYYFVGTVVEGAAANLVARSAATATNR